MIASPGMGGNIYTVVNPILPISYHKMPYKLLSHISVFDELQNFLIDKVAFTKLYFYLFLNEASRLV